MNKSVKLIFILVSLMLVANIIRLWSNIRERGNIISQAGDKLQAEEEKKEQLKRDLAKVQSLEYIEKEAREKLNLGKEGEYTVILPPIPTSVLPTPTIIDTSPNWKKWASLFY